MQSVTFVFLPLLVSCSDLGMELAVGCYICNDQG